MQQSTIRQIVDKIDSALGADADASRVEKIAADILADLTIDTGGVTGASESGISSGASKWAFPLLLRAHLSLSDCASRLSATLLAKTYDKIRRIGGSIPPLARQVMDRYGVHMPPVSLALRGTHDLLLGYRKSDILEFLSTMERSAIDAGFNSVDLLDINLETGDSRVDLLDLLPDLLRSTTLTRVRIHIGSSSSGVRAAELLDTAEALFTPEINSDAIGPRVTLYCNGRGFGEFAGSTGEIQLDLDLSVCPLLDSVRDELPADACYGDRMALLATVGRRLAATGDKILDSITSRFAADNMKASKGVLSLSLNAPGEGPAFSGIWAGYPISPVADNAASLASASFLGEALLSDIEDRMNVCIVSDALPLTYSLRNVRAFSKKMTHADLAGYLVEVFAPAIKDGRPRWLSFAPSESTPGDNAVQIPGISGSVSFIERTEGWKSEHFSCGGCILPSTRPKA
ncbi:MAG: hypothetical protein IIA50_02475 [Bacteroidetes bacterium]|nr:hypothetical protein [Bacteroidota bacterium]